MADAKLIVKPAHMEVTMKPGSWPDLPKMEDTIKRAGYKPVPEEIELRLTGKVAAAAGRLSLEVDGLKSPVTLALAAAKEKPDVLAELEKQAGQTVEITGLWQPPSTGSAGAGTLAVTGTGKATGTEK